jgi:hypothetical protein
MMGDLMLLLAMVTHAFAVLSIFIGPALLVARLYMYFAKKGSNRIRRLVTVFAVICCIWGSAQLVWYYYIWPNMHRQ